MCFLNLIELLCVKNRSQSVRPCVEINLTTHVIQDSNKEDILIAENDDGKSAKAWMPGGELLVSSKMDIFQVYSVKEESQLPDIELLSLHL